MKKNNKKILCFYEYPLVKEKFEKEFKKDEIIFLKGNVQDYEINKNFKNIEIISVFISSILNKKNIEKFPNLKLIQTRSTGTDHIDLEYCAQRGIEVKNISDYGNIAVAEYTAGLLFEISKKITLANLEVKKNKDFSARGIHKIETFELANKTIGIIGTGKIGKHFIQIAQGLQMNILAFDKFPDHNFEKNNNFQYTTLNKLLKNSDIISLHLPLLKSTKHILSEKQFNLMKDEVIILNTSRGGLINTNDFYQALKNKKIKAAGLDVLENEDCLGREHHNKQCDKNINSLNKKIIKMNNVIITPHNAFNAKEATERRIEKSIDIIKNINLY